MATVAVPLRCCNVLGLPLPHLRTAHRTLLHLHCTAFCRKRLRAVRAGIGACVVYSFLISVRLMRTRSRDIAVHLSSLTTSPPTEQALSMSTSLSHGPYDVGEREPFGRDDVAGTAVTGIERDAWRTLPHNVPTRAHAHAHEHGTRVAPALF